MKSYTETIDGLARELATLTKTIGGALHKTDDIPDKFHIKLTMEMHTEGGDTFASGMVKKSFEIKDKPSNMKWQNGRGFDYTP